MAAFKAAILLIGLIKTDDIIYVDNFISRFFNVTQIISSSKV